MSGFCNIIQHLLKGCDGFISLQQGIHDNDDKVLEQHYQEYLLLLEKGEDNVEPAWKDEYHVNRKRRLERNAKQMAYLNRIRDEYKKLAEKISEMKDSDIIIELARIKKETEEGQQQLHHDQHTLIEKEGIWVEKYMAKDFQ